MPRKLAFFIVATLVLLVTADASARKRPWRPKPPRAQVRMTLVDASGRALRTFNHHGSTFVLGEMGTRYGIRLHNPTNRRVEVVVAVDGRDVVDGQTSRGVRNRGYVIAPFGSTTIQGFRTSLQDVAAFRFTSPGQSFAGRHGQAHRVGTIRAMVFREQAPVMARPLAKSKRRPAPRSAMGGSADMSRRRGNNLGTQFGERRFSQVREVSFMRERKHRPNQLITLRYDDRRGLAARGILPVSQPIVKDGGWRRPPPRRRFAQPPP